MLFHEVHAQLSEGAMFYSDLLQRLAQLNQTCEDLVSPSPPKGRVLWNDVVAAEAWDAQDLGSEFTHSEYIYVNM